MSAARIRLVTLGLVGALATVLTACGGGSGGKAAVGTSPTPSPSVTAPADTAAATIAVKHAYATFFSTSTKPVKRLVYLQDAAHMSAAIRIAARSAPQHNAASPNGAPVSPTRPSTANAVSAVALGVPLVLPQAPAPA